MTAVPGKTIQKLCWGLLKNAMLINFVDIMQISMERPSIGSNEQPDSVVLLGADTRAPSQPMMTMPFYPYWDPASFYGHPNFMAFANMLQNFGMQRRAPKISVKTQTDFSYLQDAQVKVEEQPNPPLLQSADHTAKCSKSHLVKQQAQEPTPQPEQQEAQEGPSIRPSSEIGKPEGEAVSNLQNYQSYLQNMLNLYNIEPEKYEQIVRESETLNGLLSLLIAYFDSKITTFKKSKEEMIKLVIRKAQRHFKIKYSNTTDHRFQKYGGYKSMNTVYLENLFSDSEFGACFKESMRHFLKSFHSQNAQKLQIFLEKVVSYHTEKELKAAIKFLDEKNRMPWPLCWIAKLDRTINEISSLYIHRKQQSPARPDPDPKRKPKSRAD